MLMRDMGSHVVYDGKEALEFVQDEEPEVMVLDLRMPGVDGYEVACDGADDPRPDLAAMAVHRGWGLIEMRSAAMSLEEVFIQLTTEEDAPEKRLMPGKLGQPHVFDGVAERPVPHIVQQGSRQEGRRIFWRDQFGKRFVCLQAVDEGHGEAEDPE